MYGDLLFGRINTEQGLSVQVTETVQGIEPRFAVKLTDLDANEIVGIMIFRNHETAISAAKGMVDPA